MIKFWFARKLDVCGVNSRFWRFPTI